MTELSLILGVMLKAFFEIEMAIILLKSIFVVFLKRDSALVRMLSYAAEPVIYPFRLVTSKSGMLSRIPVDISACIAFIVLASLDVLFGIWF